jgi:cytochrome b561
MLTPAAFTTVEEILLFVGLAALAAGWLARRFRGRVAARPASLAPRAGGSQIEPVPAKYHPVLVVIHWFVAFAIANLLLRGALVMRYIPNNDQAKIDGLRAHMFAGTLVLALMVVRLVLRRVTQRPSPATTGNHRLDWLARISHRLLYVLVIAQASSGLFMGIQTGLPEIVLTGIGTLPVDFWAFPVRSVHYVLSRLLMVLIALHLTGALYHTFILKDGLLRRMAFDRSQRFALPRRRPALHASCGATGTSTMSSTSKTQNAET